jgi:O-antigen biosynthesis protein
MQNSAGQRKTAAIHKALNSGTLKGNVDSVSGETIVGWAINPAQPEKAVSLTLYIDDRPVKVFLAEKFRKDLAEAGIGNGNNAFSESISKRLHDGALHKIDVRFTDTDRHLMGSGVAVTFPKHNITEVNGFIDNVNERQVAGWAFDVGNPQDPLVVELMVDNEMHGYAIADRQRNDLKKAAIGTGSYGFAFPMPLSVLDNEEHTIAVRVAGTAIFLPGTVQFRATSRRFYKTFQQYLCWSLYYHEMHQPFNENDKCVIAEMLRLNSYYDQRYSGREQLPLVSVIMPTYNRAHIIREAINSVLKQSCSNWELIIIDDGGSDGTEDVVSSYRDARIRYLKTEINAGPSAARAAAMEVAAGAYFAYLDSDNRWHKDYLKIMINFLMEHPSRHSAYCAQLVYSCSSQSKTKKSIRFAPFARSIVENVNYIDINCFVHNREIYSQCGGFRRDIRMLEDWDLVLRYSLLTPPLSLPCILSYYYQGKSTQVTFTENIQLAEASIRAGQAIAPIKLDFLEIGKEIGTSRVPNPLLYSIATERRTYESQKFVSIIIPSYESSSFLEIGLESIIQFSPEGSYEIIIVDNASVGDVLGVIAKYSDRPFVKVIQNDMNLGFSSAVNQGIKVARSDSDIILFNNDALATEGWLEAFWEVRSFVPEAAVIVPRQTLLAGAETSERHVPRCNPMLEVDVNLSAHHDNVLDPFFDTERGFMELSFAAFFCVYLTRDCVDAVGELDERNGRHYRSDITYCDLTKFLTKRKIIYTPHAKLYHFLQRATAHLRDKDAALYQLMFAQNAWVDEDPFNDIFGHA